MKKVYIYKLIDPQTSLIRYVGKTTNLKRRLSTHLSRCKTNKYHSARWIKSLLDINLKPLLELVEECNENNWQEREIYWIAFYKTQFDLTNTTDGGEGGATLGRLGKTWTKEHRENNRKARLGMRVNHTKEGNYNRKLGQQKFRESTKVIIEQYSLDNNFIKEWESVKDAANSLQLVYSNITKVCKGQRNNCGGFIWKFKNI